MSMTDEEFFAQDTRQQAQPQGTQAPRKPMSDAEFFGGTGNVPTDIPVGFAAAAAGGTATALRGADYAGGLIDKYVMNPILGAVGLDPLKPNTQNPLTQAASGLERVEKSVEGYVSPEASIAKQESTPTGNLFEPSTWKYGSNPTARGYLQLGADLFGRMLPVILGGKGLGYGGAASAGGLQGGGAAVQDTNQTLDRMQADGSLQKESKYYRTLIENGMRPEEALAETKSKAAELSFLFTTPISALGGAATNRIMHPLSGGLAARSLPTRVGVKGALGAAEEGTQEVAEGIAQRFGANVGAGMEQPLMEGTFGEFLLGALGGGPVGALGAGRQSTGVAAPEATLNELFPDVPGDPPPPGSPSPILEPSVINPNFTVNPELMAKLQEQPTPVTQIPPEVSNHIQTVVEQGNPALDTSQGLVDRSKKVTAAEINDATYVGPRKNRDESEWLLEDGHTLIVNRRTGKYYVQDPNAPPPKQQEAPLYSARDIFGKKEEAVDVSTETANLPRIADLLSANLYGGGVVKMGSVAIKEMLQNSFDAMRNLIDAGQMDEGNIDIRTNMTDRSISFLDDGAGMSPEILGGKFLEIAGTQKEGKSSGGFGISKMVWMFGSESIKVTTMRDGKVATLSTTGPKLYGRLQNPGEFQKNTKIQVRPATREDLAMFPKGHGTQIAIRIPESYVDKNTGDTKSIEFPYSKHYVPTLTRSPLFNNIEVKFNGEAQPMGKNFPLEEYFPLQSVQFPWGKARVYVTRNPVEHSSWGSGNVHVLSNGIYQFSTTIEMRRDMPVQRTMFVDIDPAVRPESDSYPFTANREHFSGATRDSFDSIFKYIAKLYLADDIQQGADSFGNIQYVSRGENGDIQVSAMMELKPDKPKRNLPTDSIRPGGKLEVKEDKLLVDGKELPYLSMKDLEDFHIDPSELRVPDSMLDFDQVMIHDGTDVLVSPLERRSIIEMGREKFGTQFDEYMLDIGEKFIELRNVVAHLEDPSVPPEVAKPAVVDLTRVFEPDFEQQPFTPDMYGVRRPRKPYLGLLKEIVGISFDPKYYGVSIRIPFSGSFLNIGTADLKTAVGAAVDMVQTMIHEFAHHRVRSHQHNQEINREDPDFPSEMQRITALLTVHETFNLQQFRQEMIDIVNNHFSIFQWLDGVYNGLYPTEPRGKRFSGAGSLTGRDGSVPPDLGIASLTGREGAGVYPTTGTGETTAPSVERFAGLPDPADGPAPNPILTRAQNAVHVERDAGEATGAAVPRQPENSAARRSLNQIFANIPTAAVIPGSGAPGSGGGSGGRGGGGTPPVGSGPGSLPAANAAIQAAAAHADRINWLYKWMAGLDQLVTANPLFTPLIRYYEKIIAMHREEATIHDAALRVTKAWKRLPQEQGEALTAYIDDIANMNYRTPAEVTAGIKRMPLPAEERALAIQHKMAGPTLQVYKEIQRMFDGFLKATSDVAIQEAHRTLAADPAKLAARLAVIQQQIASIKNQPYFPFMRFGRHYVLIRDASGAVISVETFERKGLLSAESRQRAAEKVALKTYPRNQVEASMFPASAAPLLGLPPSLLQSMQQSHALTPGMISAIAALQRSSARSFPSHFKRKDYAKGYSHDFMRSFSRYFFHGAKYYSQVKWGWQLSQDIQAAEAVKSNKAAKIAEYMTDHLQNTVLDARGDFGWFKGAIFLWAMGYVPAAATQNLTQTPMITFPYLAAKFGDIKASKAIIRAMTQVENFWKKGSYDNATDFEMKAFEYGIKTGRISEAQASEIAGLAQGRNTLLGSSGNTVQRKWSAFMDGASYMFEMAEQTNRRIAFRAGLELAMANPTAKMVTEANTRYADEYQALLNTGKFSPAEARAVIAAVHVTEQTQYVYARYARPRFMRGPLGGMLFVFKKYIQSTMFMLGQNPDVLLRYMLIAIAFGGLGGVPGGDDIRSLVKGAGRHFFGKDWDVDKAVREYVTQHTDGTIPPDMVLHGLSRYGFGIPALLDLAGSTYTGRPGRGLGPTEIVDGKRVWRDYQNIPFPVVDRSRAITMGSLLPLDVGRLLAPGRDANAMIGEQTQKGSGAVFSVGFNMYKAAFDSDKALSDPKRWERAIPRILGSTTQAFRAYYEGRERSGRGGVSGASTIVRYDRDNPENYMERLGEIAALAMGYQPLREQGQWDLNIAKMETEKFFSLRKQGVLAGFHDAIADGTPKAIQQAREELIKFNKSLPKWAVGQTITADTLEKSMETRARERNARESGIPTQESKIGISRHLNSLYPEATIDVRRPAR